MLVYAFLSQHHHSAPHSAPHLTPCLSLRHWCLEAWGKWRLQQVLGQVALQWDCGDRPNRQSAEQALRSRVELFERKMSGNWRGPGFPFQSGTAAFLGLAFRMLSRRRIMCWHIQYHSTTQCDANHKYNTLHHRKQQRASTSWMSSWRISEAVVLDSSGISVISPEKLGVFAQDPHVVPTQMEARSLAVKPTERRGAVCSSGPPPGPPGTL